MEFLFVLVIFSLFMLSLSLGRFLGREGVKDTCKAGDKIDGVGSCGACSTDASQLKLPIDKEDDGLENIAKLGNPKRHRAFNDKFDFRPERSARVAAVTGGVHAAMVRKKRPRCNAPRGDCGSAALRAMRRAAQRGC